MTYAIKYYSWPFRSTSFKTTKITQIMSPACDLVFNTPASRELEQPIEKVKYPFKVVCNSNTRTNIYYGNTTYFRIGDHKAIKRIMSQIEVNVVHLT